MTKFGHKICIGFRMRTTSMINWGGIRRRHDPMYQPDKICFVNPAYQLFSRPHCTASSVAYQWIKLCKHTRLWRQYRADAHDYFLGLSYLAGAKRIFPGF